MPDSLVFHAREKLSESLGEGHFKMLGALAAHAADAGWQVERVAFSTDGQDIALSNPRHLHVFMDDRPAYGTNAVHSVPTYLRGFWYFDEIGSRNNSLQRLQKFEPKRMSVEWAKEIHAGLFARFVDQNQTKFPQLARGSVPVSEGCVAFFAQDFKAPRHHRHYMTVIDMIEAAIRCRRGRPVYIKPHPNQTLEEIEQLAGYHDPKRGIHVTQASIHDLLAAADYVVTVSSAVGFEAFLHRKPVILGGQTDFWQNAITLTDPDKMEQAVEAALNRHWPYEKFLVWFLHHNCVEDTPAALPKVLDRLFRKGFTFADTQDLGYFGPA